MEHKRFFRPEFLNRLTGVVVFRPLEIDHVRQILDLLLLRLNERLKAKGVSVEPTASAVEFLIEKGFSSESGARGLEKAVEKEISIPLSKLLIERHGGDCASFKVDLKIGSKTLLLTKAD